MTNAISKVAASVAVLGLVASSFVFAFGAHAAMTTAEMEALIAQLQAQLAGTTTTTTATFSTDLTLGSKGADVTALQNWLIGKGFTIAAGATGYFGAQTQAALAKYQASVGITPAAGYFGPITRAKVNASTTTTTTTTTTTDFSGTGEGYLDSFKQLSQYSAEEVGEGEDVAVLGTSLEANDADQKIERVNVTIDAASVHGSSKLDKYIDSASVLLNGKTLGTVDVTDASKSGTTYTFRFTNLSGIVKKGDKADLTVEVAGVNTIDSTNTTSWNVTLDQNGIRAVSPNGVDDTYGPSGVTTTFTVAKFADANNVELQSSLGDDNLDSTAVEVSSTATTNDVELLAFTLKAKGSDMNITDIPFTLASSTSGIANKLTLKVNGDSYSEVVPSTGNTVTFSDLDLNISEGDTLDFTLSADINKLTGSFVPGSTLSATLNASSIVATDESNDDVTDITGSAIGNDMSFYENGIIASFVSGDTSVTTNNSANDDTATFTIKYRVTAFGDDVYVSDTAGTATGNTVQYAVDKSGTPDSNGNSAVVTYKKISGSVTDSTHGVKLSEGSVAEFTLTVSHTDDATSTAGLYRSTLAGIDWATSDALLSSGSTNYAFNLDDYKTDYVSIN